MVPPGPREYGPVKNGGPCTVGQLQHEASHVTAPGGSARIDLAAGSATRLGGAPDTRSPRPGLPLRFGGTPVLHLSWFPPWGLCAKHRRVSLPLRLSKQSLALARSRALSPNASHLRC